VDQAATAFAEPLRNRRKGNGALTCGANVGHSGPKNLAPRQKHRPTANLQPNACLAVYVNQGKPKAHSLPQAFPKRKRFVHRRIRKWAAGLEQLAFRQA
jgi:hypothetical protein